MEGKKQAQARALGGERPGPAERDRIEAVARELAREEVASLCGLVLRRLQEPAAEEGHSIDGVVMLATLREIFGEALRDFGGTDLEPGDPE